MTTIETNKEIRVVGRIIKLSMRGWGFITSHEMEFIRIFFHWGALVQDTLNFKELEKGMMVEFTPIEFVRYLPDGSKQNKGWRALRIKVIENDANRIDKPTEQYNK